MNAPDDSKSPWDEPGVFHYFVVSLSAMGAILLLLLARGFGIWSLLPILAGILGNATRLGPALLCIAIGISLNGPREMPPMGSHTGLDVPDLILCAAMLAYVVAHRRLQSLLDWIFPPDSRRRSASRSRSFPGSLFAGPPRFFKQKRDARLVSRQEIGILLLSLPLWAALAQICWRVVPREWGNPGILPGVWQAILVSWIIGLVFLCVATGMSYWYSRLMSPQECHILLQDELWKDTRREQRRFGRWLAWGALRRCDRKEKT
jgi:hypothetical protein